MIGSLKRARLYGVQLFTEMIRLAFPSASGVESREKKAFH